MSKALKIGLLTTILIYVFGVTYTYYSNYKFNQHFEQYDLDKNGTLSGNEITEQSQLYLNQKVVRKTTKQAIIVLIPVSIFIGFICFGIAILFKKIKTIDDNEINYQ